MSQSQMWKLLQRKWRCIKGCAKWAKAKRCTFLEPSFAFLLTKSCRNHIANSFIVRTGNDSAYSLPCSAWWGWFFCTWLQELVHSLSYVYAIAYIRNLMRLAAQWFCQQVMSSFLNFTGTRGVPLPYLQVIY
jgi:hypothetical protein